MSACWRERFHAPTDQEFAHRNALRQTLRPLTTYGRRAPLRCAFRGRWPSPAAAPPSLSSPAAPLAPPPQAAGGSTAAAAAAAAAPPPPPGTGPATPLTYRLATGALPIRCSRRGTSSAQARALIITGAPAPGAAQSALPQHQRSPLRSTNPPCAVVAAACASANVVARPA